MNNTDFRIKNNFSKNKWVNMMPKINKMTGELPSDERPDISTENRLKVDTCIYCIYLIDVMTRSMEKRYSYISYLE